MTQMTDQQPVDRNACRDTDKQAAEAYGLSEEELSRAMVEWLNCEGYADDGHECMTVHEWLTHNVSPPVRDLYDYEWAD